MGVLGASSTQPPAGSTFENCTDARAQGYTNILRGSPGYAPKLDGDNDGVACEDGESGVASGSGTSGSGSAGELPATGSSGTVGLALFGIGFVLLGSSALTSDVGRKWLATSDPNVRYTIDRVTKRRR